MKITPQKFVSYIRVSTKKQGESGLGLEAQQHAVAEYIGNGELVREFREIETGTSKRRRPVLQQAIRFAKSSGATLVIAKLDRLSRNVYFISGLMESKVDFVAADMPSANTFTLHILAAVAEDEARRISERTKAAMDAAKRKGVLFGSADPKVRAKSMASKGYVKATRASAEVRTRLMDEHYADIIPVAVSLRDQGLNYSTVAKRLNDEGYRTRTGQEFTHSSIYSILMRSGKVEKVLGCVQK